MALAYKTQLLGANNPNYRNNNLKKCLACGKNFASYQKNRKFCSHVCYVISKKTIKPEKKPKEKIELNKKVCRNCATVFASPASIRKNTCSKKCQNEERQSKQLFKCCSKCGKEFKHYASQSRIYCSYKCHLDSGGAFRAGIAAAEATMKYGARKDANHNEVMAELRKYCAVYDLSALGMGIPDGIAWIKGAWHLFDIKNPKTGYGRRGLNEVQKKWIGMYDGGPVYLIYTNEEAARFAQGSFDDIKFFKHEAEANVDTPD